MALPIDIVCRITGEVQEAEKAYNLKWGYRRLPCIVSKDLALRFYLQEREWIVANNEWDGRKAEAEEIERQGEALIRGYHALDQWAEENGRSKLKAQTFEFPLKRADGTIEVGCIVDDDRDRKTIQWAGRKMVVYTLGDIAAILQSNDFIAIAAIKAEFPGATIERITKTEPDWDEGDELPPSMLEGG